MSKSAEGYGQYWVAAADAQLRERNRRERAARLDSEQVGDEAMPTYRHQGARPEPVEVRDRPALERSEDTRAMLDRGPVCPACYLAHRGAC